MRQIEHNMQVSCVRWFRLQYSQYSLLLFAVPNGGRRDRTTGAKLKAEGVVAGVADIILLVPSNGYHGLLIELKTATGRQSESQRAFMAEAEKQGYLYVVVRSVDDFVNVIKTYLDGAK